ncbi:MAG: hypothetical protein NWE78_06305 [Candidatus Bathyarchaeota archaeon]|nr:hypothetical protein [Candidatus Bathyarchaeota archaeon]
MKRNFLGFGIILLFVGVILFSYFNTPPVEIEEPKLLEKLENSFDVSAEFNKSQKLLVLFGAPRWDLYPIPDPTTAIVDVDVYDPYGNKTEFRVQFYKKQSPELWLRSNDTGGLEVSSPLEGIVGITKYSGEYRAHIKEEAAMFYNSAPPPTLSIFFMSIELEYPNRGFLYLGIAFVAIGFVVSVWSARSPDRKTLRRSG